MGETVSSNSRIAKNTIILYARMILMMFIGLYTSRVILRALGISDLGLMNVAGSVIGMFTFLNGTLTGGTQRFITFAIGEGNMEKLKRIFASAMTLHLLLGLIIVIVGETVGLWYIYNKLVVEPGRFEAAMWCYQFSILSTFVSIVLIPFNSALVAHEHMGMYAYMAIYDVVMRLLAAYLIMIVPYDRVIFYSILTFVIGLIPTFIYNWYCRKHFEECAFRFGYDKLLFKKMLSFSGWDTIGCLAAMGQGTGVDLVLNAFCGTVVNGARGIAFQANGWVTRFVDNFLTAVKPQITKSYAARDYDRMGSLVCYGASFGCYLLLLFGIPLFIEIEWVLNVWLGECPEHTIMFMRIMMIETLFRTMGTPTITAMHATGQIKVVNLTVAVILLTIVPLSYILLSLDFTPEIVMMANVIPWIIVPPIRVFLVKKYSGGIFPVARYLKDVMLKTLLLAVIMFIPPYCIHWITTDRSGFTQFVLVCCTSLLSSVVVIYYLALNKQLRGKMILIAREAYLSYVKK